MPADLMEKTVDLDIKASHTGIDVERIKESLIHAAEDKMRAAKRAVRHGRDTAEDLVDDAARQIKRHPFESAGLILGIGFGVGLLTGLLFKSRAKRCDQ